MKFIATYYHEGETKTFPYSDSQDKACKAFQAHMEKINPTWANLASLENGEVVDNYQQKDIVGVFEGVARTIKEPDGRYVAVWTDGVIIQQKGNKTKIMSDSEQFAAFRLRKDQKYRITVTRINE